MYLAHHISLGACITWTAYQAAGPTGAVVAVPLAFASHHPLDWFGERAYGPLWSREWITWELLPIIMIAAAAWLSGAWWAMAIGGLAGAGMDLWDKGRSMARHGEWFAEPGIFHRNNPPRVTLTAWQTKAAAVVAGVVPLALVFTEGVN